MDVNGQEFHLRPSYPATTETSSHQFGGAHFALRKQTDWKGMVINLKELMGYGSGESDAGVAAGSLLGAPILVPVDAGGWYEPAALFLLPPSAFFLIGGLVWAVRSWEREQAEPAEPRLDAEPRR